LGMQYAGSGEVAWDAEAVPRGEALLLVAAQREWVLGADGTFLNLWKSV
jgi:hypothetical protein